ncbi:MAG: DUF1223 domain-containing protein, partial [Verrucomicrobiae bacterium]|nr:DUF1223 domain-containing protein [Verrucomicrobiae bacterium]
MPVSGSSEENKSPLVFESGSKPVPLIELFTSQGCSSCPPADAFLTELLGHERLWKDFVPVAWHVDYWDRLGWPDPFASGENTQRQYRYRQSERVRSVYTPGFVIDGAEWRGFFQRQPLPGAGKRAVPDLRATIADDRIAIALTGSSLEEKWTVHAASLGFGLSTAVTRGENTGRTLRNDFVVLEHRQMDFSGKGTTLPLPARKHSEASRFGLAIWISKQGEQAPVQATGGF